VDVALQLQSEWKQAQHRTSDDPDEILKVRKTLPGLINYWHLSNTDKIPNYY